jgi:membrane protease YdiL (CAAX protease family)
MIPEEERPEEEPEPFPTPVQAIALTFFATFLQGIFILMLSSRIGFRVAILGISAILAYGFVFSLVAPRLGPAPAVSLGFVRPASRAWTAVLFLSAAVLLVSEINNIVLDSFPLPEGATEGSKPEGALALFEWAAVLVLVLPLIHEIFFRGVIQPLQVERFGAGRGIGFVALLQGASAALIGDPRLFPEIAATALLLGFVRHQTGSLLPALGPSALFGAIRVGGILGMYGIPGFDDMSSAHTPLEYLAPAGLFVGIGLSLCRTSSRGPGLAEPPTPT